MAVKSVIEIQIDDTKFKDFKSLFDDYKAALEETPDSWKDVGDEMSKMVRASELLRNDAQANLAILQQQTIEEDKAENKRRKAELEEKKRHDENIKRWKAVGSAIKDSAFQLAKFASIGLGIAGGASVFGFNKLAFDASNARFQSMGLGITSGAMQSANINYQSLVANPSASLAAIRDAKQDLTKQKVFLTAGISNYQNKTADELMPELILAAQKMAKETPQGQLAQVSQAMGYDQVFSMEDLTRFKEMTVERTKDMIAQDKQDKKSLAVSGAMLDSYQDLQKQWDRFGQGMENTFIRGLVPLAPALQKLSESSLKAFETLMSSDKLPPLIDKMSDGITKFANYLGSGDLENDFKGFMSDVDKVITQLKDFGEAAAVIVGILGASSVINALKGLLGVGGGLAGVAGVGAAGYAGYQLGGALYNNAGIGIQQGIGDFVGKTAALFGDKDAQAAMMANEQFDKSGNDEKANYAMQKLMAMGWSKEQAAGIAANLHHESGFRANAVGDSGHAYGIAQWHGDRQRKFEEMFGHSIKGSSIDEQLKFVDWELNNTESSAGGKLKAAMNAREAGQIVSQFYERPADVEGNKRSRGGHAALLASRYVGIPAVSHSDYKGTPIVIGRGEKDINGKVKPLIKDTFALRKPTADQQKSVMFQNQQGGMYGTDNQRVQIQINNATGGNANVSALSL